MSKTLKAFGIVAMLFLALVGAVASANATLDPLGVQVVDVKVNGDSLNANQAVKTQFERDSELSVKVQLQTDGTTTVEDVEVSVFLTGSKDDVSETSEPFNVAPNTIYTKSFTLTVPQRLQDRTCVQPCPGIRRARTNSLGSHG